jgi:hypothetical protein
LGSRIGVPDRSPGSESWIGALEPPPARVSQHQGRRLQEMEDWPGLAELLLGALGDEVAAAGHPTWIGVRNDPLRDRDIGLWFVDDDEGLLGWRAPPECIAVGVLATGRAQVTETPVERPQPFPPGVTTGIRMCCLVTRSGEVAWRLTLPDGRSVEEAPQEGRLLDCLKRCFSLPTPPPPVGPGHLLSVLWLSAVLDEVRRADRRLTWGAITHLHPWPGLIGGCRDGAVPDSESPHGGARAGGLLSWEGLRLQAITERWWADLVSSELAAWMDEGMFARWVLGALPAPDELVARIRPLVAPSTARRLAHAVRSVRAA